MNTNGPIQIRTSVGLAAPILNAPVVVTGATLQVSLSWSAAAGATGYVVERSIGGTTWTAFPAVTATSAIDSTVAYGTSYSYRVSASNATSTSSPSNVQTVTTPAILNAPTIGTVSGPTGARVVTIRWSYANQGQTGFAIERAPVTGGVVGAFAQVATAGTAARSATNTLPAIPATRPTASVYVYRVVALRNTVRSDPSANSTLVTLLPAAAAAPSGLSVTVTAGQTGALAIRFRDNAVNESGFTLERQLRNANGTWGQPTSLTLPAGSGIITTADSGLLSARVYRYRVRAYNDRGPSAWTGYQSAQTN